MYKTEKLPQADVWCFGSPCTNISIAGNKKGLKGEQSGLFFEVMRILNETPEERKPAYLFMENVKNLLSVNGGRDFAKVLIEMDEAGYDVEWQVINSSWVIPQNRERIFVVGHKRGRRTRRVFPLTSEEIGEERQYGVLKDVLEPSVDEKYNLSQEKLDQLRYYEDLFEIENDPREIKTVGNISPNGHHGQDIIGDSDVSVTLTSSMHKHPVKVATTVDRAFNARKHGLFGRNNEVIGTEGISPTLTTPTGGGSIPNILIKNATKEGCAVAHDGDGIDFTYPNSNTRRGRVQKGKSHTLTTGGYRIGC